MSTTKNPMVRGINLVFGVPAQPKPIENVPLGQTRLVFRNTSPARLFVRTKDAFRVMFLENCGEFWRARPDLYQGGSNRRVTTRAYLPGANIRAFKAFAFV